MLTIPTEMGNNIGNDNNADNSDNEEDGFSAANCTGKILQKYQKLSTILKYDISNEIKSKMTTMPKCRQCRKMHH